MDYPLVYSYTITAAEVSAATAVRKINIPLDTKLIGHAVTSKDCQLITRLTLIYGNTDKVQLGDLLYCEKNIAESEYFPQPFNIGDKNVRYQFSANNFSAGDIVTVSLMLEELKKEAYYV